MNMREDSPPHAPPKSKPIGWVTVHSSRCGLLDPAVDQGNQVIHANLSPSTGW